MVSIEILSLNKTASKYLRILDFNLGIIEDKVVVVDVLYYLYWLLTLLLWL